MGNSSAGLRNAKWRVPAPPGDSALGHTPTRNENAPRARALVLVTARYLIAPNGDGANRYLQCGLFAQRDGEREVKYLLGYGGTLKTFRPVKEPFAQAHASYGSAHMKSPEWANLQNRKAGSWPSGPANGERLLTGPSFLLGVMKIAKNGLS